MAHVPWRTRCEYRCEHVTVYLNLVTPDASYGLVHYIDSPHARVERAVSTQSAGAIIPVVFLQNPGPATVRARAADTGARSRVWTCYVECKVCYLECMCWATGLALGIVCGA